MTRKSGKRKVAKAIRKKKRKQKPVLLQPEEFEALRAFILEAIDDFPVTVEPTYPTTHGNFVVKTAEMHVCYLVLQEDGKLWAGGSSFDIHNTEEFRKKFRRYMSNRRMIIPKLTPEQLKKFREDSA